MELDSVRSTLLSSKLRIAATSVAVVVLVVLGLFVAGVLGVPSVAGVQNSFGDVNETTTEVETEFTVHNPNPIGVTLGGVGIDYTVEMNGLAMANGSKDGVSLGTGNTTLPFRTELDNQRIPTWWASHVRNGENTSLDVDATVCTSAVDRCVETTPVSRTVETDVIGNFNSSETRPIEASESITGPVDDFEEFTGVDVLREPFAAINRTSGQWGEVTAAETPIEVAFDVYNPQRFPLAITQLEYNVTMNGVDVGDGVTEREYAIPSESTETVRTTVALDNPTLDEWWVSHLENDQVTELRIDFYARVDVAGTEFRIPLRELAYEKTIRTDVFGNKNATAGGDGPSSSGGPGETTSRATIGATTGDGSSSDGETTPDGDATSDDTPDGDATTDDGIGIDDGTAIDTGLNRVGPSTPG